MRVVVRVVLLLVCAASTTALKVAVSGAGGQTGGLVFRKLLAKKGAKVVGWTRTEASQKALQKATGCSEEAVKVVDVRDAAACLAAMRGMDALVIATSATPKMTGEKTSEGRPVMDFPDGGAPKAVDWLGQKTQIDACVAHKAHVVICSSMGGTNPENPLNAIGRKKDGKGGDILLWKRKAEKYAMGSGAPYTIVHPGGLINEPGGQRELVAGVDDTVLSEGNRSIPREDVATVLVAALFDPAFRGRSFDVRSNAVGDGAPTPPSCVPLLAQLGDRNCDYSLGKIP